MCGVERWADSPGGWVRLVHDKFVATTWAGAIETPGIPGSDPGIIPPLLHSSNKITPASLI